MQHSKVYAIKMLMLFIIIMLTVCVEMKASKYALFEDFVDIVALTTMCDQGKEL